MKRWKQLGTIIGLLKDARSWMREGGVSMMSESSQSTQAVDGPMVVKRREFRARDMADRRAF